LKLGGNLQVLYLSQEDNMDIENNKDVTPQYTMAGEPGSDNATAKSALKRGTEVYGQMEQSASDVHDKTAQIMILAKRTHKVYHCGGGDEGGQLHPGSFFSGGVHCRHLHSTIVLAATQGRAEGPCACSHSGGHPGCRIALWRIDRSFAE
jgi:hypothetical protein